MEYVHGEGLEGSGTEQSAASIDCMVQYHKQLEEKSTDNVDRLI